MWEFLGNVAAQHGLTAAVMLLALGAAGWFIWHLWKRNQALQDQLLAKPAASDLPNADSIRRALDELGEKLEEALREKAETHALEIRRQSEEFARKLNDLHERRAKEAEVLGRRIDELQERRLVDAKEITREVVKHVEHTRQSVDRISVAMDTLTDVLTSRGRHG